MKPHPISPPIAGFISLTIGMLLILTSFFPQRNLLTKTLYWLCTLAPRIGSISDKTWVMVNGIGLLLAGVVLLTLSLYGVI
jgi:hypothetical protein